MSLSGNPPTSQSQQPQPPQSQRITRQSGPSNTTTTDTNDSRASSSSSTTTAASRYTEGGFPGPGPGINHIPPTPLRNPLPPIRIPELDSRLFPSHHQYQAYPQRPHPLHQSLSSPLLPVTGGLGSADPYTGTRHLPHPLSSPGQLYPPGSSTGGQYFNLSASTSSSPLSDTRVLRSPHPPLTAILHPSERSAYQQQPSHFLQQQQQLSHLQQQQLQDQHRQLHHYQQEQLHHQQSHSRGQSNPTGHYNTISPLYEQHPHTTAPPHLPPLASHLRSSPPQIPPPLRFHYSATPPTHLLQRPSSAQSQGSSTSLSHAQTRSQYFPEFLIPAMPPRRKAAAPADNVTMSTTPQTISSTTSSRPRKSAKGNGWTMEHTYDSVGHKKEVIVIDDSQTPEHPPRKRTRAQVAAENAAIAAGRGQSGYANGTGHGSSNGHLYNNGTTAHSVASTSSAGKKRKVDEGSDPAKKKGKAAAETASYAQKVTKGPQVQPVPANQTNTWDDAEGHYIVKPDDIIGHKYKIVRLLGQGTFGKVVEARNVESRRKVAIKVIRAVQKYRDASKIEIRVLETLRRHDPGNTNHCIHMDEYFDHRNHPCIVSELYGMSVFDFLKQNSFSPFPERHIQDFAKSLLKSVDFLHRLKLVHTDLKPENILLVSNESRLAGPRKAGAKSRAILKNTDIRLIDFGSATFENEYHSSVVSTRHYRAPEIILGLPWSYPCDMFSIGCILVEFYTGDALFQTHDNLEHLAMMEVVMGKMPQRMIDKARVKKPEFFKAGKIDFPNASVGRSSRKYVKCMKSLAQIIPPTSSHNKLFLDLIERLLDFDPDTRITVDKALSHPYLKVATAEPPSATDV